MPNNFLWPPDLAPAAVQAPCRPRGGAALTLLPTTASTNDRAARERGAGLVVADSQAAGRGRRGRSWQSPAGANLYWSAMRGKSVGLPTLSP